MCIFMFRFLLRRQTKRSEEQELLFFYHSRSSSSPFSSSSSSSIYIPLFRWVYFSGFKRSTFNISSLTSSVKILMTYNDVQSSELNLTLIRSVSFSLVDSMELKRI